jgi:glycosyltransferase involved in cell wall biosynthesis
LQTHDVTEKATGKVSVLVPCFNEADTVTTAIEQISALRDKLDLEIVVVDDGSTDGSFEKVSKLAGIKTKKHTVNRGKGAAILTAAGLATGDVFVIQDADLEYDAGAIPTIVGPILAGKVDVVYGSRFKGDIEDMSFSHLIGNKVLSYFTSLLCGAVITDMMTCQKAFRASVFRGLNLKPSRFEFELDVTVEALRRGYSILEVPIPYEKRKFGEAKIDWWDGVKTMLKLFRYRLGF